MRTSSTSDSTAKNSGGGRVRRDVDASLLRYFALMVSCIAALCAGCGPGVEPGVAFGGYAGTCAAGERKVCLGRCAQLASLGGACDRDPCASSVTDPVVVCGTGLRCEATSTAAVRGTCQPIPTEPSTPPRLGACDPAALLGSAENPCGQFTAAGAGSVAVPSFCKPIGNDNSCIPSNPTRAACFRTAVEGETCDGDWEDVLAASPTVRSRLCEPCGPGFRCANSVTGGPRTCLRRCDTNVGGPGACRAAPRDDRPWIYECQPQPWQRRAMGDVGPMTVLTPVCIRVGQHLGVCGSSIASFETRQIVSIGPVINDEWDNPRTRLRPDGYAVSDQFTVLQAPPGVPRTGCAAQCDNCVVTRREPPAGAADLAEPVCCVQPGGRCGLTATGRPNDDDCCDFGTFSAQCVLDPQSGPSGAQLTLCRRGCNPAQGGNLVADGCSGVLPPNPPIPPSFQCPGVSECRQVDITPGPGGSLPAYACMPCGRAGERACTVRGREGCTVVLSTAQIPAGGILPIGTIARIGSLFVDGNGICQPVAGRGALGQPCHDLNVRSGALCSSGPRLPQGDRCNGLFLACSNPNGPGTCVPCGQAAGQPACEGSIALIGQRTVGMQPTLANAVCAENRLPFNDPIEGLRCPGDPPRINPPRCIENALGNSPRLVSAPARNRYSGEAGVCIACGNTGQACCESQLCQNATDTCDQGVCVPCGQQGQPCCRCNPNLSGNGGCAATNQAAERLSCQPRSDRPGVCEVREGS
jgi:hypothetical protein